MIIQTWAILVDSLRLLRSRYLFWLSLGLSAIAAIALFGTYSFTDTGLRFLWFQPLENPMLTSGTAGPRAFVAGLFNGIFVRFWLAWGAMILAVVSTSSILPEFLAGGAIDLSLSKPISRLRLLLLKIAGAVLFVAAQVGIGVGLAYLIIGLRFGIWQHGALLAIPLLTLQFFYLYSVSTLIAVVSRSTLAALIGTILFWFMAFLIQFSSNQLDSTVAQQQSMLQNTQARIEQAEKQAEKGGPSAISAGLRLPSLRNTEERQKKDVGQMQPWRTKLNRAELFVPKTGDIQKIIAAKSNAPVASEFRDLFNFDVDGFKPENMTQEEWDDAMDAGRQGEYALRDVNIPRSLLSSTVFALVMLTVAMVLFKRKDF